MRFLLPLAAALASLITPVASGAQTSPQPPAAILAEAGPGTRWGMMVVDEQGRELIAIDPDGRFVPASNTKIFTTAAAMRAAARGALPEPHNGGARVRLEYSGTGEAPDVVFEGQGDARLSSASTGCASNCIADLAAAVAKVVPVVRDVIGDDSAFPDQRWSPGMSWNNIPTRSGTGVSALSLDDNEIAATVTSGALGQAPAIRLSPYYSIDNRAQTVPGSETALAFDRLPGGRVVILSGTIGTGAAPEVLQLGIDDPAEYAAWRFAEILRARGVTVSGTTRVRHRPLLPADDPAVRGAAQLVQPPTGSALAVLSPPPLIEDIAIINKVSQNLHAELLLRRLGRIGGSGSIADGQAEVSAMLREAQVPAHAVSLSDGSGMSTYNRVSPRGMTTLLRWIAAQPWGEEWRRTLPLAGADGTLARRFAGTPLAGRIYAKTGTLNATNALAGYMRAASGKVLTFAVYANDVPDGVRATAIMDRALLAVAAAH